MHIGLFGFGYWGRGPILKAILNNKTITKITVCTRKKVENILPEWNNKIIFTNDEKDILDNINIEAVIIATPALSHYELAVKSLQAGKHILVEKPFTTSYKDANELMLLAENLGKIVMVDHTFLYTDAVKFIKKYIDNGNMGIPKIYNSSRIALGNVSLDSSVVWDLAVHDLALLDYLGYEYPDNIVPVSLNDIYVGGGKYTSNAIIELQYPNFKADIHVSWDYPKKDRTIYITSSEKVLLYDDTSVHKIEIYNCGYEIDNQNINYFDNNKEIPLLNKSDAVANMLDDFIYSILNNSYPVSHGYRACKIIHILEQIENILYKRC